MDPVLIAVTPLSAEETQRLNNASGGPRYALDPDRYFWARDAKGWLVSVRHADVLQPRDVAGDVGGSHYDY